MAVQNNHVLIFDFDGTIADTFHCLVNIGNRLSKEFHFKKIKADEIEFLKGKNVQETIRHLNIPLLKIPMIVARAKQELNKNIALIKPIGGLKGVLRQLKNLKHKMGILTSNSLKNVTGFLDNHGLNFFDFIQTTSKIWSKNKSLLTLANNQALKIADMIYIGDETRDIIAAQKAGIRCAAVTWGYNTSRTLEAHQPDFLIHSPRDLFELFRI